MDLNMIVAVGRNGAIGRKGELIWYIPEDLKRFKRLTTGHPVIMGRTTWESLPKKPLPGRRNIVLTTRKDMNFPGAETAGSIAEAMEMTAGEEPFVIGGAAVYNEMMPYVGKLYLTEIDSDAPDADAFLNLNLNEKWEIESQSEWHSTPEGVKYRYTDYKKVD